MPVLFLTLQQQNRKTAVNLAGELWRPRHDALEESGIEELFLFSWFRAHGHTHRCGVAYSKTSRRTRGEEFYSQPSQTGSGSCGKVPEVPEGFQIGHANFWPPWSNSRARARTRLDL